MQSDLDDTANCNGPAPGRRALVPVLAVIGLAVLGGLGLAGWLMQGDPMFMSLAVSGLRGCF